MMSLQVKSVVPVLRMFDVAKARQFYVGFLGMTIDWVHGEEEGRPLFMQVSMAGLTLYLSEHHGDGSPGASLSVYVEGLDEYHRGVQSKDYKYMNPGIEETPWKTREMEVIDPSGNRIRFCERIVPAS